MTLVPVFALAFLVAEFLAVGFVFVVGVGVGLRVFCGRECRRLSRASVLHTKQVYIFLYIISGSHS